MSTSSGIKDLRPLALGELIDRSAIFWRAHLIPLFVLCLGFELVNYILAKGVTLFLEHTNALMQGNKAVQARIEADPMGVLGDVGTMMGSLSLLSIVVIWSYWLATLVITRYVVPLQLGEPSRPADGLRRGLRQLGSFTGAYLLSLLWGAGITLLLMIPGGLLFGAGALLGKSAASSGASVLGIVLAVGGTLVVGLGWLAAFLWYFLRFSLLASVFAMEDLSAVAAFRRSGALISGRIAPGFMGRVKVRAMVLFTALSGIVIAASFVFSLPSWILRAAYGQLTDPSAAAEHPIPQALLVPVELFQVFGQSVFTPLALVFYAMFYLDMRMRREGLDLGRRLDTLRPAP
ncbi:hypothetical protein [Hyalangium versicolor]|uniref:hypothetical protein n=1 Tax=Hyalangium versicolor TaxID=2861190 RepID=UPI001CD01B4A|nr:hypothetical protein [Hyalangium versicolor]